MSNPQDAEGWKFAAAKEEYVAATERGRMFFIVRPKLFLDGNQWCALYGENVQSGVVGFGDSPDAASYAFDKAWFEKQKSP